MDGIIYIHYCHITKRAYVGQTTYTVKIRKRTGYGPKLTNAIKKYGWENFSTRIIGTYPIERLDEAEMFWIAFYNTVENGYNITSGGCGTRGYRHTEAHKMYMSNLYAGLPKADEHRKNMSIGGNGKKLSAEHKRHISESTKGRTFTPIHSYRKSLAQMGGKNPSAKPVQRLSKSGILLDEYDCIVNASKSTNIGKQAIQAACARRNKSAGGFIWRYK